MSHVADRNRSATRQISYDQQRRRFDLPEAIQESTRDPFKDNAGKDVDDTRSDDPLPASTDQAATSAVTATGC